MGGGPWAAVNVFGVQYDDGRIERFIIVETGGDESLTAEQARQFAAVPTEAADEIERLESA